MVYRGLYSYRQRVRDIALFPNIFFILLLVFLKEKSDAYKWLIYIMQHFQVRVNVFNCQQILAKFSFIIFDIVVKNKSNVV